MTRRLAVLVIVALGATACHSTSELEVQIPFRAVVNGVPFACDAPGGFKPFDLRLFVHGVELIDAAGQGVALQLTDDQVWQSQGVALLDFEDGSGSCRDGSSGTNTTLRGKVPQGKYRGVRFIVGVPFELNHANPAVADAPLNLGRMSWGWQGGYKFVRFEGEDGSGATRLHLGSTGCEGTIGDISRCNRPNRPVVQLDGLDLDRGEVQLDLGPLLGHGDCMSEIDDKGCPAAFAALGLDLASGAPRATQSVFSIGVRHSAAPNGGA